jgi:hypothetical protein
MEMSSVLKYPMNFLFSVNAASNILSYHNILNSVELAGGLLDCEGYGRIMPLRGVLHAFMSVDGSVLAALVPVVSRP